MQNSIQSDQIYWHRPGIKVGLMAKVAHDGKNGPSATGAVSWSCTKSLEWLVAFSVCCVMSLLLFIL